LRDLRGHGVQGARIDVYHLRRTGKHRRLVKTGLKTRAHGNLTLILPLNVDTRRIEFALPSAATGPDHEPPDAPPNGHAPRNGVRADAEVARRAGTASPPALRTAGLPAHERQEELAEPVALEVELERDA